MSTNYTVLIDDEVAMTGSRLACIGFAKVARRQFRTAGESFVGRVEVRNARGVKVA